MKKHVAYLDAQGKSRLAVGVDMTSLGTSTSSKGPDTGLGGLWVAGADYSQGYYPGSPAQLSVDKAIDSTPQQVPRPVRPRHPRRGGRRRARERAVAPGTRRRARRVDRRRARARRARAGAHQRCARRHRLGHPACPRLQHPRAERQPRRGLDRVVPDRSDVPCGTQRGGGRHHGRRRRRQLRRRRAGPRDVRHDRQPGQRAGRDHGRLREPPQRRLAHRGNRQPLQLARPDDGRPRRRVRHVPARRRHQARAGRVRQSHPERTVDGRRQQAVQHDRVALSPAGPVAERRPARHAPAVPERHVDRGTGRVGHRRTDAAGQPRPHAAARQDHPPVQRAAAAERQPRRTGRGPAERRRCGRDRVEPADRHRERARRGHAQSGRLVARGRQDAPRASSGNGSMRSCGRASRSRAATSC